MGFFAKGRPIKRVWKPGKLRKVTWGSVLRTEGLRQSLQVDRATRCSEERPCCLGRLHQKSGRNQWSRYPTPRGCSVCSSQEPLVPENQAPHWITSPRKHMNTEGLLLSYFLSGLHYDTHQKEVFQCKASDISSHVLAVALDRPNQYVILLLAIYNSTSPTFLWVSLCALVEAFYWFLRLYVCMHCICAILCGLLCT